MATGELRPPSHCTTKQAGSAGLATYERMPIRIAHSANPVLMDFQARDSFLKYRSKSVRRLERKFLCLLLNILTLQRSC
jgi:hypothetical protein